MSYDQNERQIVVTKCAEIRPISERKEVIVGDGAREVKLKHPTSCSGDPKAHCYKNVVLIGDELF